MKKATLVDLVYLKIAGGRPSPDVNVKRIDIVAYLPAAINTAIREQYFTELQLGEEIDLLPDQFIKPFEDVPVLFSTSRDLKYIDLPEKPIAFLESSGVRSISPMKGDIAFEYIKNRNQLKGYEQYAGIKTFFWLEGDKALFQNISPLVDKVLVILIGSMSEVSDDDEAPIPFGLEEKVINNCYNWFSGERFNPADEIENSTDLQNNK